jgi:hypothetical protein
MPVTPVGHVYKVCVVLVNFLVMVLNVFSGNTAMCASSGVIRVVIFNACHTDHIPEIIHQLQY